MSLGRAFDEALRADPDRTGTIEAEAHGDRTEVDVIEADKLGVRVTGVRVRRDKPFDIAEEARGLPDRLRLPERLEPIEVAPELGGAVLRTHPDEVVEGEFYELGLNGDRDLDLKRYKVEGGERKPTDWTMTRPQLRRLIDDMS